MKNDRMKRNGKNTCADVGEAGEDVSASLDRKTAGELSPKEKKWRSRSMDASHRLFRFIDIALNKSQNNCPYVTKKNVGDIECAEDIVYDESERKDCLFDVYRVPSAEKQAAVIYIHGGGFTAGGKRYRRGQSRYYALNGFTTFSLDYGLSPAYTFPKPLAHIVTAGNYIFDHADEYNIDRDNILVAGDSAGAYYAAMVAALEGSNELVEIVGIEPKFKVAGALLICGLYDIDTVMANKYALDLDDAVFLHLTGTSQSDFDSYEYKDKCAPIAFVTERYPPSFLIYSPCDIFCKGQSEVFMKKLQEKGVYCESYAARSFISNHCFSLSWRGEDAACANALMLSFAKRLVAGKIKI